MLLGIVIVGLNYLLVRLFSDINTAIHAVDSIHAGKSDSSVLYIPSCPLTELNAHGLARQRDAFLKGKSFLA